MRRNDGKSLNYRKYQGGWLLQVIQGVAAIGGALINKKASDKAGSRAASDRGREFELEERRLGLAEKADERSEQLFQQYLELYAPREAELLREAFDRPISPAAEEARATADVRSSLETARGMSERNLRRVGAGPQSGTYQGLERARSLGEAKIEAGARTRARQGVRDLNFGRQASLVGLGRGLPVASAGFAGQAAAGVGGAAGLAALRSAGSQDLAYQAGAGYGKALGEAVGTIGSGIYDWWKNRQQPSGDETDWASQAIAAGVS